MSIQIIKRPWWYQKCSNYFNHCPKMQGLVVKARRKIKIMQSMYFINRWQNWQHNWLKAFEYTVQVGTSLHISISKSIMSSAINESKTKLGQKDFGRKSRTFSTKQSSENTAARFEPYGVFLFCFKLAT